MQQAGPPFHIAAASYNTCGPVCAIAIPLIVLLGLLPAPTPPCNAGHFHPPIYQHAFDTMPRCKGVSRCLGSLAGVLQE